MPKPIAPLRQAYEKPKEGKHSKASGKVHAGYGDLKDEIKKSLASGFFAVPFSSDVSLERRIQLSKHHL